jgi:hypothetical protein
MISHKCHNFIAVSLLSFVVTGCGGGGSSSTVSPAPASSSAAIEVIEPETTPTPEPTPTNVDFSISEQNDTLVRYAVGNAISYSTSFYYYNNPFSDSVLLRGTHELKYVNSVNPVIFEDGVETLTKKFTSDVKNDELQIYVIRNETEEVVQFPVDWAESNFGSEWVYKEHKRGLNYDIKRTQTRLVITIPA